MFPLTLIALLAPPSTASALEAGVRVEPGLAVPLTAPQTPRFGVGGEVSLKGYLGLGRYFDAQAGVTFVALGAADGTNPATAGTAWATSFGVRLKRPHDAGPALGGFSAASPWLDGDAHYVKTGGLDRFGLTTGAGTQLILAGNARATNIYWAVGTSATLGTNSAFKGTLLMASAITMQTGASIEGRLLAQGAAVALDTNLITVPAP